MSINANDVAGFDAFVEEIRYVYAERDALLDEVEALRKFKKDVCETIEIRGDARNDTVIKALKADKDRAQRELIDAKTAEDALRDEVESLRWLESEVKRLREVYYKEMTFTGEAASILGVHHEDLSLSDILEALRKLKREEKLDDMNASIIEDLKTGQDNFQKYAYERIGKELGLERIPDSVDDICDVIADLRNYRDRISCPKSFWDEMCNVMEMDPDDTTPTDVIDKTKETKRKLISVLAHNPETTTWTDIYNAIKAVQKDNCDLITESYKMRNELLDFAKARKAQEDFTEDIAKVMGLHPKYVNLGNVISTMQYYKDETQSLRDALDKETADFDKALHEADEEAIRQMRESYIYIINKIGGGDSPKEEDLTWYEHRIIELFENNKKSNDINDEMIAGLQRMLKDIYEVVGVEYLDPHRTLIEKLKELKALENDVKHADERRRHWVGRYKEEHERAVNLDKLYREWKEKYETYYKQTSNMREQNESLTACYNAVKNTAITQKGVLKIVCRYLAGKDDLPVKDIVSRLNEMWTKEFGWDGLVKHYGANAIKELIDACDDELTEKARKDLDEMLK